MSKKDKDGCELADLSEMNCYYFFCGKRGRCEHIQRLKDEAKKNERQNCKTR